MSGFSLSWLQREREELRRDRHTFATCLDLMKNRCVESNETEIPRTPLLHQWSGTQAVVASLEMALHAVERTLEEVNSFILAIEKGEVMNVDAPVIRPSGGSN